MRIENINEGILDDIISEIERCPLDTDREQLRGWLIARLSDVRLKNWFGKEHSQDYKGFCKYCGTWC